MDDSEDSTAGFTSPMASLKAFAQSTTSNLLPSFERARRSATTGSVLPAMLTQVSFDPTPLEPSVPANQPPVFHSDSSPAQASSVAGKFEGVDHVGLFVFQKGTPVCCGRIGSSDRFCTIVCKDGESRCGVKAHSQKLDGVEPGYVYICSPATLKVTSAAFASPSISLGRLGDKLSTFSEFQMSVKAWNRFFSSFENIKDLPLKDLDSVQDKVKREARTPFTTAKRRRASLDEESSSPKFSKLPPAMVQGSFASFSESEDAAFKEAWVNVISYLQNVQQDLPALHRRLKRTKMDLEIAIQDVESSVEMVNIDIGNDPGIDNGAPVTSLWSGVQLANRTAQSALSLATSHTDDIAKATSTSSLAHKLLERVQMESRKHSEMGAKQDSLLQQIVHELTTTLNPTLMKLVDGYKVGAGNTNLPLGFVLERLRKLETVAPPFSSPLFPSQPVGQPVQGSELADMASLVSKLSSNISRLDARYATLEDRLLSESVTLANMTFGSLKDTVNWVKMHVPGYSYEGFHDIMSLLQMVTEPHIGFSDGMSDAYLSQKVGFTSRISAIIAHSFRLELPDLFGKITATSDKSFPLPAVKLHKQWNPNDGVSGVLRYTNENLVFQVESCRSVISQCYENSKAFDLASIMLSDSHSFWTRLSTWMNEFLLKLTIVSSCSETEAWLLVASCVRGIFRELRKARLVAQNAETISDSISSTGYFLWGALQAHRVMKSFITCNFESHPAITPIVNMHLFQFRVPLSLYKSQKDKITDLQNVVTQLKSDLDRLKNVVHKKKNSESS